MGAKTDMIIETIKKIHMFEGDIYHDIDKLKSIKTNIYTLDFAFKELKGIPKKQIVEIFGPHKKALNAMVYKMISNCQKDNGVCAVIKDKKENFDYDLAETFDINLDKLLIYDSTMYSYPVLEIINNIILNKKIADLIVIDTKTIYKQMTGCEYDVYDNPCWSLKNLKKYIIN